MISVNEAQSNTSLLHSLDLFPKHGNFSCTISSVSPEREEGDQFDLLKKESGMNNCALNIAIKIVV